MHILYSNSLQEHGQETKDKRKGKVAEIAKSTKKSLHFMTKYIKFAGVGSLSIADRAFSG